MNMVNADEEMDTLNNNHGITIWCDGCYDMTHFGHANNLRQAKNLGNRLIVGVHSDEEIEKHKGSAPVFNSQERYDLVRAIKWVDEVVENAPYVTSIETLDNYGCTFCAHGNDITTTSDGMDTYQMVKDAGRYLEVERTQGVSTTGLLKRILNSTPSSDVISPYTGSALLLTTRKLALFADRKDPHPLPTDRIVYVDGTFDIFHPGHLAFLREARKLGDYVIVGLHDDKTAALTSESEENKLPIMNLQERAMNVLANRYVDEIVLGAPYSVSKELLEHLKVNVVAHGIATSVVMDPDTGKDPYEVPKSDGIFQEIDSGSRLTTQQVMDRAKRNKKQKHIDDKERKEAEGCRAMQAED